MKPQNLPRPGPRYWTGLCLASVFGANLGDFCSHGLGLGHWRGLPFLAVVFAAILLAERRTPPDGRGRELFYWLAVVVLRTAATNLGDLLTHDMKLAVPAVVGLVAVLLAVAVGVGGRRAAADATLPPAGSRYWLAMLLAGTFGTAAGDGAVDPGGLGLGGTMLLLGLVLAGLFALRGTGHLPGRPGYWILVAAIRTVGTNAGDFVISRHGLGLGLSTGTLLTGLAMATVLPCWSAIPRTRRRIRTA